MVPLDFCGKCYQDCACACVDMCEIALCFYVRVYPARGFLTCLCVFATGRLRPLSNIPLFFCFSYEAPLSIDEDVNTSIWWKRSVLGAHWFFFFPIPCLLCAGAMFLMCYA